MRSAPLTKTQKVVAEEKPSSSKTVHSVISSDESDSDRASSSFYQPTTLKLQTKAAPPTTSFKRVRNPFSAHDRLILEVCPLSRSQPLFAEVVLRWRHKAGATAATKALSASVPGPNQT